METYHEKESDVSGFDVGSAYSSGWPDTNLPGMHGETDETGFDEDCLHVQQDGGNDSETRGGVKKDNAEPFMFSDPESRWFEFSQFADLIIGRRIEKNDGLLNLSGIYTIRTEFAEEVATRLLQEEVEKKILYTRAEASKRIHAFINLRIRTWLNLLRKQDLITSTVSSETIVEKNEEGEVIDLGKIDHESRFSEDNKNPFHHDQLEVMLAEERELVLEKALKIMASKHTRRSREYMALIARLLGRPELTDDTILNGLTNYQINILTFHAINKRLSTIVRQLYPVEKTRKTKHHKIPKTPFKILKKIYRKKPALWNNECNFNEAA